MGQAGSSRRRASRRTRAGLLSSVAVFAVGITTLILMTSSAASGASVSPTLVSGNPTCADLGLTAYSGSATITQVKDNEGTTIGINFTADPPVLAVIVKGGDFANVYDYQPGGSTGDTGLVTPINPSNDKNFGLSHVTFCGTGTTTTSSSTTSSTTTSSTTTSSTTSTSTSSTTTTVTLPTTTTTVTLPTTTTTVTVPSTTTTTLATTTTTAATTPTTAATTPTTAAGGGVGGVTKAKVPKAPAAQAVKGTAPFTG
jgi:hypothetical protein